MADNSDLTKQRKGLRECREEGTHSAAVALVIYSDNVWLSNFLFLSHIISGHDYAVAAITVKEAIDALLLLAELSGLHRGTHEVRPWTNRGVRCPRAQGSADPPGPLSCRHLRLRGQSHGRQVRGFARGPPPAVAPVSGERLALLTC